MARALLSITLLVLLSACSEARVLGGDANSVWVKDNLPWGGDAEGVAARHCARFGKKAVLENELKIGDDALRTTRVYACR